MSLYTETTRAAAEAIIARINIGPLLGHSAFLLLGVSYLYLVTVYLLDNSKLGIYQPIDDKKRKKY